MIIAVSALILGLLTASTKSTFDSVNGDLQKFAAELVLLDRDLWIYGADADNARTAIVTYTQRLLAVRWTDAHRPRDLDNPDGDALLNRAEISILALQPKDSVRLERKPS
jgi:hypothetical protein